MAIIEHDVLEATRLEDKAFDATLETLTSTSVIVYGLEIDNSDNNVDVYGKFYNATAASGVGTADPDMVLQVDAGEKRKMAFSRGVIDTGVVIPATGLLFDAAAVGLKAACVTDPGTAGTTGPTNAVGLRMFTD